METESMDHSYHQGLSDFSASTETKWVKTEPQTLKTDAEPLSQKTVAADIPQKDVKKETEFVADDGIYDPPPPSISCSSILQGAIKIENLEKSTIKKHTKRFYSLSEKLIAVEFAERTSTNRAAREYNVDRKRVKEWRTNKEKIIFACKNCDEGHRKRQRGGGKKPISNDLERAVLEWVESEMLKPQPKISWRILQARALEIFNDLKSRGVIQTEVFKASNGWLQNFLKRHSTMLPSSTANQSSEQFNGNLHKHV